MSIVRHLWHVIKYSDALTRCVVATKNGIELHIHSWRLSPKVREVWVVNPYEDRDGMHRVHEVPEEKVDQIIAATSFEHAMAILRSEGTA